MFTLTVCNHASAVHHPLKQTSASRRLVTWCQVTRPIKNPATNEKSIHNTNSRIFAEEKIITLLCINIASVETLPELWGRPLARILQSAIWMLRRGVRFTGLKKHLRHNFRFAIPSDADIQMLGHLHDATILDGAIAFVRVDLGGEPDRPWFSVVWRWHFCGILHPFCPPLNAWLSSLEFLQWNWINWDNSSQSFYLNLWAYYLAPFWLHFGFVLASFGIIFAVH